MKKLNDWPTFPQIIVNGELIGGLDILKVSRHNSLTSWPECMLTLVSFHCRNRSTRENSKTCCREVIRVRCHCRLLLICNVRCRCLSRV